MLATAAYKLGLAAWAGCHLPLAVCCLRASLELRALWVEPLQVVHESAPPDPAVSARQCKLAPLCQVGKSHTIDCYVCILVVYFLLDGGFSGHLLLLHP
jgi:hypothetical protein